MQISVFSYFSLLVLNTSQLELNTAYTGGKWLSVTDNLIKQLIFRTIYSIFKKIHLYANNKYKRGKKKKNLQIPALSLL